MAETTQNAKAEIAAAMNEINHAWRSGRLEALAPLLHDDVVFLGPNLQEFARGRAACVEGYREFVAHAKVHEYSESGLRVDLCGDVGVCCYRWTMTCERDGNTSREKGVDQFVFGRFQGRWLAVWRMLVFEPAGS